MELEINYDQKLLDIKDKKTHFVASGIGGLLPFSAYMSELEIKLSQDESIKLFDALKNNETVTLAPNNLTVVPHINLSVENIADCFEANENYIKCETLFFDLERYGDNDLYEIIKQAFDNYQFRHTKKVLVSSRQLQKKYTFKK